MRRRLRKPIGAQIEQKKTRRISQGKQAVDPMAQRPGRFAQSEQGTDRQRVKRFVQKNHQERSKSEQAMRVRLIPVKFHARRECHTIQ